MRICLTWVAGAVLLAWPALLNGYPLLFSDTGGLLDMALIPDMGWDKPWVYSPFLLLFHGLTTLWLPAAAQCLALSWILWITQRVVGPATPGRHLALCLLLAAGSAAPWFAPLLMPDIFAPMAVLCVFALGFHTLGFGARLTRLERFAVAALGVVAVGVHLSHLIVAAACLVLVWGLRLMWPAAGRRWAWPDWRPAVPLGGALAVLLATNLIGNGVLAVSPYGSVFMLARLVGDGPAAWIIERDCPQAGWHVCGWVGRLGRDSDAFLWHPDGPIWANGKGPIEFAPEASRIVALTLRAYPGPILRAMLWNGLHELTLVRVGDALVPDYLDDTVLPRLRRWFPPEEIRRYQAGLQRAGRLEPIGAAFWPVHLALLGMGGLGTLLVLVRYRRDRVLAALCIVVLGGLLANAATTGALSTPHHRYQARIAWLLLLPPALALMRRQERGRNSQPHLAAPQQ